MGYKIFQPILVRVTAKNEKGSSVTPSAVSTGYATAKFIPVMMPANSITRGKLTSESIVQITISPLTTYDDTGNSTILSYNVEWD